MATAEQLQLRPGDLVFSLSTEKKIGVTVFDDSFPIADPEVRWEITASIITGFRAPAWIDMLDIWSSREGRLNRESGVHQSFIGFHSEGDQYFREQLDSIGVNLGMSVDSNGELYFEVR